jgi:WD40 repeat protein
MLSNVFPLAFSPGGKLLASASGDGTARPWDLSTSKAKHALGKHGGNVYAVAFFTNANWAASAGAEPGTIWSWRLPEDVKKFSKK